MTDVVMKWSCSRDLYRAGDQLMCDVMGGECLSLRRVSKLLYQESR